jgi:FMN reductase
MTHETARVVTLSGSPAQHSRSAFLLRVAAGHLAASGIASDPLDVRDLPPAALLRADPHDPKIAAAIAAIAGADALIVATPVYKAAYSGVLKAFLDVLPAAALNGKVVLPIATGGSAAHMLAVDYALKPVLSALGARYVLGTVYATDSQLRRHADEKFDVAPDVDARLAEALDLLRESLHWTAHLNGRGAPRTAGGTPSVTPFLLPDDVRCSA